MIFDGFHLPGLAAADVLRWEVLDTMRDLRVRYPVLRPAAVRAIADRLRAARRASLDTARAASLARRIGAVATRFGASGDPIRAEAERLLPAATGYSPGMVAYVLDGMAADWTPRTLEQLLAAEFGDAALDSFVPLPNGATRRALGPELALNLFAGNVPGVAVTALIRCLLVKAAVLGKTGRTEPVLPVLFARALSEVEPDIGQCLAVSYWPGGSTDIEAAAFAEADTIIVYGAAATVRDVRARAPARTRIVEHGPRISVALVGRAALGEDARSTAAAAARAVATFDQLGCVSPHVVYVEAGAAVSPVDFARMLADELRALEAVLPRGRLSAAEAAATIDFRAGAEFREIAGADVRVLTHDADHFTVVFEADPGFQASCLHRSVRVKPIERLDDVPGHLEPVTGLLQTVGLAGAGAGAPRLAESLAGLGASRITTLRRMPWPPADWSHDGKRPLAELVRWVDLEVAR